jgi:hypothetical protein
MPERLQAALEDQAQACEALGSPFTARLMRVLARVWPEDTGLASKVAGWSGDLGPRADSVPLRIAGGLHGLVRSGRAAALAAVYPPLAASEDALAQAVGDALRRHDGFLCDWVKTAPQTNEVARSAALIAGASEAVRRFDLPLVLSELGASAGLNLWFDRYALQVAGQVFGAPHSPVMLAPEWSGPPPPQVGLRVVARRGVDLAPLDPARDADRLMAFVWADQTARLGRLRAALSLAEAGHVDAGDAADWLQQRLETRHEGRVHLVFHTVAHQYFPQETQERIEAAMVAAGARAVPEAPLGWLGMEGTGDGAGACITLRLWPGDLRLTLGRSGFHGEWVDWRGAGSTV